MSLTKDDVREVFNEGIETLVLPRFDALESRMDGLDSRMDGLDSRMDGLDSRMDGLESRMGTQEKATIDLRQEMRAGFAQVNERIDGVIERLDSMEEDIRQLYADTGKLKATPGGKQFRTLSVSDRVLRLNEEIRAIAKQEGIKLPQ
jgi:uncharacterized coiled-coil protein SlyX